MSLNIGMTGFECIPLNENERSLRDLFIKLNKTPFNDRKLLAYNALSFCSAYYFNFYNIDSVFAKKLINGFDTLINSEKLPIEVFPKFPDYKKNAAFILTDYFQKLDNFLDEFLDENYNNTFSLFDISRKLIFLNHLTYDSLTQSQIALIHSEKNHNTLEDVVGLLGIDRYETDD